MARFEAVRAKHVGAAVFFDQLVTRLSGDGRQKQVGEPTLRRTLDEEVSGRWSARGSLGRWTNHGRWPVDLSLKRTGQPIGEDVVLFGPLIGDQSFGGGARKITVAGGTSPHQGNQKIAS